MKIRIVNKKLRKFQQDGLYTSDDGFGNPEPPKFQVNPILSPPTCPPGQSFNDILQKCVTPEEESQFKKSMQGFSDWRTGKVPNQMKSTGNEGTDANPMGRGPVETSNPLESSLSSKSYDPTLASILTAGLFGLSDILQKNNLQQASRKFQIKSGMTDSYFPVVPNVTSRGTTEINTGEMFPNLRVPVQFPGNPYASINRQPYFGMAQEGALIPKVPYDVPEIDIPIIPSFNYTMGTDIYSNAEETAPAYSSEATSNMIDADLSLPLDLYGFRVGSGFGPRKAPMKGASTNHNGIDLGMTEGSNIYSVKPGVILSVRTNSQGGNEIIIQHDDGTRSGYAHLKDWAKGIKEGDKVSAGQVIGYVGSTGVSTAPHLHFTYRNANGDLVDPYTLFDWNLYGTNGKKSNNVVNSEVNAQISFTHNNPLNIHYGDFARQYGGTKGHVDGDGNVAMFQDFNTGITAARDLLFGPNYKDLTVSEARKKWVGGPSNSISHIIKAMGGDKLLSGMSIEEREKLIKEFARWEGKQAYNLVKDMDLKPYLKGEYKEGGEYELTDDEIDYILANGGEIEYL